MLKEVVFPITLNNQCLLNDIIWDTHAVGQTTEIGILQIF